MAYNPFARRRFRAGFGVLPEVKSTTTAVKSITTIAPIQVTAPIIAPTAPIRVTAPTIAPIGPIAPPAPIIAPIRVAPAVTAIPIAPLISPTFTPTTVAPIRTTSTQTLAPQATIGPQTALAPEPMTVAAQATRALLPESVQQQITAKQEAAQIQAAAQAAAQDAVPQESQRLIYRGGGFSARRDSTEADDQAQAAASPSSSGTAPLRSRWPRPAVIILAAVAIGFGLDWLRRK